MSAARKAERLGHECATVLSNRLLNCKTLAEGLPHVSSLLVAFGKEPRRHHAAIADGIAVALTNHLLIGLANLPTEIEK